MEDSVEKVIVREIYTDANQKYFIVEDELGNLNALPFKDAYADLKSLLIDHKGVLEKRVVRVKSHIEAIEDNE